MSDCFTDICLSDTDTASSLCCREVASNCHLESTRLSQARVGLPPLAPARTTLTNSLSHRVLLQDPRHGLLHERKLKRFGDMGIAGGSQKRLRLLVYDVAGQEDDAPRQLLLFLDRLLIEFLAVHFRHAKVGDDQVELVPLDQCQRIQSGMAQHRGIAEQTEHFTEQFGNRLFVVENQDLGRLCLRRVRQWRKGGGRRRRLCAGVRTDHWQLQNKASAAQRGRLVKNPPVMIGQYAVRNRQPQAGALAHFLGGEERLKNVRNTSDGTPGPLSSTRI